jgi:hypothetical protein
VFGVNQRSRAAAFIHAFAADAAMQSIRAESIRAEMRFLYFFRDKYHGAK